MLEVQMLTVGPVQENCFLIRKLGATHGLVVDPGDEADRILRKLEEMHMQVAGILITHCHFDHIGAVAELARATGAEVWCPELETMVLADINSYVRFAGFGPFESYAADHTIAGGETLELAGLTLDVTFTPGHSPGHVSFSVRDELALFSGDVLFQSSVGRTDLPGGDMSILLESIATLMRTHDAETVVHPGHMGLTTLGQEQATNPFLQSHA